ncbi:conserved domain protein [Yersinia pestis KIM D27]|nr:conserved domain protein [Yersinia pestis KIM D27]
MKYLILGGYTVVANKNKISVACGAISLFVVASFSLFFSLTHYFNFLK